MSDVAHRPNGSHKCTGPHKPEEGKPDHECFCLMGKDHTLEEFWEWDHNRPDDPDDPVVDIGDIVR